MIWGKLVFVFIFKFNLSSSVIIYTQQLSLIAITLLS